MDGLRGIIILTVVVNHAGGVLWPRGGAYDVPVLRGVLGGGAVVTFFVVGAFIVTRNLVREHEKGMMDPLRFYLRRLVRLGVQLVPFCVALVLIHRFDDTTQLTDKALASNVVNVLTHTLNEMARNDLFSVRPEVGHLWYLSVQQQVYLVLPLAILLLVRQRVLFIALLLVGMALVYHQRQVVLENDGWVLASSLTTTRSDGLLWGVAVALALPWLTRFRHWAPVLWISSLALLLLHLSLPELGDFAYLGEWSIAFTLVSGVVVAAVWCLETPTRLSRFLSWSVLVRLGKASLTIFIWHFPVIVVVARHTPDWHWTGRTAFALAILMVIVVVAERLIEEPVRRLLAQHRFFRMPAREGVAS